MFKKSLLKTFSTFFPLPKALSFDFVGVDICKDSVKVVKMKDSKFGKIPVEYKEYKLSTVCSIFESEEVFEKSSCEEILSVLRTIKKDFKVDCVNVSIPEIKTYIYKTKIPTSIGVDIQKNLLFSVEENVPLKPEDVLLDYFVISIKDSEVEVVVTVVQKRLIEEYTDLLEKAGLKPISFEPETHAISRAIIRKENKNQYLLVNLDSCMSSVAVIDNEVVQYTQTLPVTSEDFVESFNEEEAKLLKENINKVIIYWETSVSNDSNKKIQTLYLVGECSFSQDLIHYLEKNLPVGVKFANVWENSFSLDDYIPKINARDSLKYATAVGLSLKKIK